MACLAKGVRPVTCAAQSRATDASGLAGSDFQPFEMSIVSSAPGHPTSPRQEKNVKSRRDPDRPPDVNCRRDPCSALRQFSLKP